MGMTLKEYLANKPDARQKEFTIPGTEVTVTLRRISVGERKQLVQRFKLNTPQADQDGAGIAMIAMSVLPVMTEEEVEQLPQFYAEILAQEINEYNGWTKRGAAELADQFRPTA